MKETGEQRHLGGTGNIGNSEFDFEEQGNKAIYFRGTGITLEGSHYFKRLVFQRRQLQIVTQEISGMAGLLLKFQKNSKETLGQLVRLNFVPTRHATKGNDGRENIHAPYPKWKDELYWF